MHSQFTSVRLETLVYLLVCQYYVLPVSQRFCIYCKCCSVALTKEKKKKEKRSSKVYSQHSKKKTVTIKFCALCWQNEWCTHKSAPWWMEIIKWLFWLLFAGSKCPSDGLDAPIQCPGGEYQSSSGQTSCTQCPAGSECSDPTTATQCTAGHYAPAGSVNCTACATGTVISILLGASGYIRCAIRNVA